jgi:hypothetical protein
MSQLNTISEHKSQLYDIIIQKVIFYEDVIKRTYISLVEYKRLHIICSNEINYSINELNGIMDELRLVECHIKDKTMDVDDLINDLQILNNKLSGVIKMYGTNSLEHLICIFRWIHVFL